MKKTLLQSLFGALILTSTLSLLTGRASLIFQLPRSERAQAWGKAGASLLSGVARILDALATVEDGRSDSSREQYLAEATKNLRDAAEAYSSVEASTQSSSKLTFEGGTTTRAMQVFRRYQIREVPTSESAAAQLAASQVKLLLVSIEKTRPAVLKGDVAAAQDLFKIAIQVQDVGAEVAVLMKEAKEFR